MKNTTRNQIHKIQELTSAACEKDGFGCCSKFFCKVSELEMAALGYHVDKTDNVDIPYMGPDGCVIPPEYRPGCSLYVCPVHLKDRKFRREWDRHRQKILKDPAMKKAIDVSTAAVKELIKDTGAMEELLEELN
jgi:hypothetical protein